MVSFPHLGRACSLVALAAEGASLGEPRLSARGLAEHRLAAGAHHHGLRVAEHSRSVIKAIESWKHQSSASIFSMKQRYDACE